MANKDYRINRNKNKNMLTNNFGFQKGILKFRNP